MATEAKVAILEEVGRPLKFEAATIEAPRRDELLVEMVATGICHTDLAVQHGHYPVPRPVVLGHEGSGKVIAVGEEVDEFAPGDHVVLTFMSCGHCAQCARSMPAYCLHVAALNMSGRREDGSTAMTCGDRPVAGHFFGQSSFSTHSIVNRRNAVMVRKDAPLELLGPLGCGIQTGAGTFFNALKPLPGQSCVVFGGGGVGLSAVMAARCIGCDPIILCEPIASRRELGLSLGATAVVDPSGEANIASRLIELTGGGADAICDTTGVASVTEMAVSILRTGGKLGIVGMSAPGTQLSLPVMEIVTRGLTVKGIIEGDSVPREFIPRLVDLFMAGEFPIDRLVTFFEFEDINTALQAQIGGEAIKPILRFA